MEEQKSRSGRKIQGKKVVVPYRNKCITFFSARYFIVAKDTKASHLTSLEEA
jgi:hypothetical protein